MRDDLNSLAQIVSFSLTRLSTTLRHTSRGRNRTHLSVNDVLVNLASRDVVVLAETDVEVSLVVSEIQVGLTTVVEDVYLTLSKSALISMTPALGTGLTMLCRSHCSGIDVHVRVNLDSGSLETGSLEHEPST